MKYDPTPFGTVAPEVANPEWDEPTETTALLESLFAGLANQLHLLPVSSAGAIGGDGSAHQKPQGGGMPKPVEDLVGVARKEWDKCVTHRQRLAVLGGMQQTLTAVRYAPPAKRIRGTLDWKLAVATDTRSSKVVGLLYGLSPRQVKRYRAAHKSNRLGKEK